MPKRESRYVRVARLAYNLAQVSVPRYTHAKSPHRFTYPQRVACVLLAFYLNRSYRDCEEWLLATDGVRAALELEEVPDHSTLNRTFQRLTKPVLQALLRRLLHALQVRERVLAGDATGYRASNASAYFQTRSGRLFRDWFKGVYAVGSASQFIVAAREGRGGSLNDTRFLRPLRREAARYAVGDWVFVADCGFDGRTVTSRDLIPPQRKHNKLLAPERRARADLVAQARLDGLFGQRWKCETVHSVIKRKFGDTVRSRRLVRQRCEPILKAVIYNLHRSPSPDSGDVCN